MYSLRVLTQAELTKVAGGDGPPTVTSLNISVNNYDPNTHAQTAATQAQIDQVNEALAYLSLSPTAATDLQNFQGHTIHLVPDGQYDGASPDGSVLWSPTGALLIGTDMQSPAMGLIHEIDHEVRPGGMDTGASPDQVYAPTMNEYVATHAETQIAGELGEPTRDSYGAVNNLVNTNEVTDHGDFYSDFYYGNAELDPNYTPEGQQVSNDYLNEMMAAFPSTFGFDPNVGTETSDQQFLSELDGAYNTDFSSTYFDDYYYTDYGYYWDQNGYYDNSVGTWYNPDDATYYYANYDEWVDYGTYYYYTYGGYGC